MGIAKTHGKLFVRCFQRHRQLHWNATFRSQAGDFVFQHQEKIGCIAKRLRCRSVYQQRGLLSGKGTGIFGNFIIKFFLTNFEQYSNLKIECSQKKGFYYVYNFPMPKDLKSFLPSFMRIPSIFWQLTVDVRAKEMKSRAPVRVYQIQIRGESVSS